MKDIKYYDVIDPNSEINGQEISISDLLGKRGINVNNFSNNLSKYKRLSDLSTWFGKQIIQDLLSCLGLKYEFNNIKTLSSVSPPLRKVISDNSKELLDIIDSTDFIVPYLYMLIWFEISQSSLSGRNWSNPYESLAMTIIKILQNDIPEISWFLCAHRENKTISKNTLVESVNWKEFKRILNLIDGIMRNLWKNYSMNMMHTEWDFKWMNAVFPKLFLEYFKRWELYKMSNLLDKHISEMRAFESDNVKINSVSFHFDKTQNFLKEKFGTDWTNFEIKDLYRLAEEDKFMSIAYYMTYEDIKRFESAFRSFSMDYTKDEIDDLIKQNIENAPIEKKETIENAIKMFFSRSSLAAKALYETAFYYLRGKYVKENWWVWMWFDRDHDLFQTEAFSLGYEPDKNKNMIPLLYGKRTGKKSWDTIWDISFRQFWHFYE